VIRIVERGYGAEPQIELAGGMVDCIDLNRTNADVLSEVLCSSQCIDEEQRAYTLALDRVIHREPAEQHDGHIQPRKSHRLIGRERLMTDAVIRDGVVA
jgi:hypothetical protein